MRTKSDPVARFLTRLQPEGDCRVFVGSRSKRGYGFYQDGRKVVPAHRFAYRAFVGEIPEGELVCHRCDNPPCCNPDHLFLGSYADNTADMMNKGREARGARHGSRTMPHRVAKGDGHGMARLTSEKVLEIRARYATGRVSQAMLATDYGVHEATVRNVIIGATWKHLLGQEVS